MHDLFGDVERFVATADFSRAAKLKLQSIMNNPTQKSQLMIELAITVDAGEPFVKATYFLTDPSCYEKILALKASIGTAFYPNTNAVVNSLAGGNVAVQQQLTPYNV